MNNLCFYRHCISIRPMHSTIFKANFCTHSQKIAIFNLEKLILKINFGRFLFTRDKQSDFKMSILWIACNFLHDYAKSRLFSQNVINIHCKHWGRSHFFTPSRKIQFSFRKISIRYIITNKMSQFNRKILMSGMCGL